MSDLFNDPNFNLHEANSSHLRADRQPCPVCGHPTGDCAGDVIKPSILFSSPSEQLDSLKSSQKILVEEDIYQERQISSYASIKVRMAKKGSYVTLDRARELGIL